MHVRLFQYFTNMKQFAARHRIQTFWGCCWWPRLECVSLTRILRKDLPPRRKGFFRAILRPVRWLLGCPFSPCPTIKVHAIFQNQHTAHTLCQSSFDWVFDLLVPPPLVSYKSAKGSYTEPPLLVFLVPDILQKTFTFLGRESFHLG